jgi:hypothetical protein
LALGEWTSHILQRNVALNMLGVGTILAISGPFGTTNSLPPLERWVYRIFLSLSTFAVGSYANIASFTFLTGTLLKQVGFNYFDDKRYSLRNNRLYEYRYFLTFG